MNTTAKVSFTVIAATLLGFMLALLHQNNPAWVCLAPWSISIAVLWFLLIFHPHPNEVTNG